MNPLGKKISLMGVFIALGISLGFALIHIPNVELITATIFISGYLLGIKKGAVVGLLTEALYSILNPIGMAAPPLFVAQVLSMSLAGCLGGILGKRKIHNPMMLHIQLGVSGFILTTIFAVLTTLSFVFFIEFSQRTFVGSFIYGLGFYLIHIAANTLIFLTIVPAVLKASQKAGWFLYSPSQRNTS